MWGGGGGRGSVTVYLEPYVYYHACSATHFSYNAIINQAWTTLSNVWASEPMSNCNLKLPIGWKSIYVATYITRCELSGLATLQLHRNKDNNHGIIIIM